MSAGQIEFRHLESILVVCLLSPLMFSQGVILGQQSATTNLQAKKILPNAARERFSEGEKLLRQGDLDAARTSVLEGLKAAPKSAEGYNLLGLIYGQRNDFAQSLSAFQHALLLDPRSALIHFNLGNSYFIQQKLDLAAREFRACLNLDPKHHDANY